MENKEEIIKRLKSLLLATRAGSGIVDITLNESETIVTILYDAGSKQVNIDGDSGIAIIKDVVSKL